MQLNKKKFIIIIMIIIVIVVIIGAIFTSGFLNTSIEKTTPFDNDFASGNFVGNVKILNNTSQWSAAYSDTENHIDYNMSTCKNASLIVDIYTIQGMQGPEHRIFNDQKWDIYNAQGMQTIGNNTNSSENQTLNVFMCVADRGEQSYIIYIIFNNNTSINTTGGVYSQAYNEYIEPLLDSITLKENANAPTIYDVLGIDQSTYNQYAELISQIKKGNQTAIQQLAGA